MTVEALAFLETAVQRLNDASMALESAGDCRDPDSYRLKRVLLAIALQGEAVEKLMRYVVATGRAAEREAHTR